MLHGITPGTARPYGHSLTLGFRKYTLFGGPEYATHKQATQATK